MKKLLALLLCLVMVIPFAGCSEEEEGFKVGFIFLHDENSTYDKNFIDAAKAATEKLCLSQAIGIFNHFC